MMGNHGRINPLSWLRLLSDAIANGECRQNGKSMNFERGLAVFMETLLETRESNGRLWWIGNGGSSAACSHLSQDALNKLGIKSQTLTDPALLTCMANDYGYPEIYSRPLEVLAERGDLLIAISSSGKSQNIINAVELAEEKGMRVISLSGFSDKNQLWNLPTHLSFYLPTNLYGITELGHEALIHSVIESLVLDELHHSPSKDRAHIVSPSTIREN